MRRHGVPYWRVVATDFDGTLTSGDDVKPGLLAAIAEVRRRGVAVVLVTGRILDELRAAFPDVEQHFDAIVAENGAVLAVDGRVRQLCSPLDWRLADSLAHDGVAHRRGDVLLAGSAADEARFTHAIRALGLDAQVVVNRNELMILPAGVSKGSGVLAILGILGLSSHNTVAIGDAENDHALFEVSELGVAVANAVPALKRHADIVLDQAGGEAVARFLGGPMFTGDVVLPRRWRLKVGTDDEGRSVFLPASQLNLLVIGGSGSGKSFFAGMLVEQLIGQRYSLLVVDPEGDHHGLAQLSDVTVLGGEATLPSLDVALRFIHHRGGVVLDLSPLSEHAQRDYLARLPAELEARRSSSGLPHWLVIDEAQTALGRSGNLPSLFNLRTKGYCLVTWQPDRLAPAVVDQVDAMILLTSSPLPEGAINLMQSVGGTAWPNLAQQLQAANGRAVLVERGGTGPVTFTPGTRETSHLRHLHKYAQGRLVPERRFHFRSEAGLTGHTAANLAELEAELAVCPASTIRHHCQGNDFSRWIADVFHDRSLARRIADAEHAAERGSSSGRGLDEIRVEMVGVLQRRLEDHEVP